MSDDHGERSADTDCPSCGHDHLEPGEACPECGFAAAGEKGDRPGLTTHKPETLMFVTGSSPDLETEEEPADLLGTRVESDAVPGPQASLDAPKTIAEGAPRPPVEPDDDDDDEGKKCIGRYVVQRTIGRGGMGEVFLARHPDLGIDVALKVLLSADQAGSEELERFKIEARTAATLVHPHIVRTYDFGETGGVHFLTQEFVKGTSLDDLIDRTPPSPRRAMEILADLAEAVHYAHENGIIHRDLKPANVLLDAEGAPKLADFGLARKLGASQLTRTGTVMGTPSYMSPEQAEGESDKIGPPSDVYGLGAILYEMLTLQPPFTGATPMEVIYKVIHRDPSPPHALDRRIADEISAICMKCLEKRPAERYASARDLADDCRRYLNGEHVKARPAGPLKRAWRKVRRNKTLVISITAVLALALAAVSGVYYQFGMLPERQRAWEATRSAISGRQLAFEAEASAAMAHAFLNAGALDEARRRSSELVARFASAQDARLHEIGAEARRVQALSYLREAEEHFSAGDARAAEKSLDDLFDGFGKFEKNDPALPFAEAYLLKARMASEQGRLDAVRQNVFHALNAAAGTERELPLLSATGHLLFGMRELGLAKQTFEKILRLSPGPRDLFLARLGIAKCTAAFMDFDRARAMFAGLAVDPEATPETEEEIRLWRRFLDLTAGCVTVPHDLTHTVSRDLDNDGKPELLLRQKDRVLVGRVVDGAWQDVCPIDPFEASGKPKAGLQAVDALDIDGDGQLEVIVGGGTSQSKRGILALFDWNGGKPTLAAALDLPTSLSPHPFAVGDYNGDGKNELFMVEHCYGRSLGIFAYQKEEPRLKPIARIPLGSDMDFIMAGDWNGNGRDELWLFMAGWGSLGVHLVRLEYNPEKRRLMPSVTPWASEYAVDRSRRDGEDEIFFGCSWWDPAGIQQRVRLGRRGFQAHYRAPGAYIVKPGPEKMQVTALDLVDWKDTGGRNFRHPSCVRLRAPDGDFALTWLQHWAKIGPDEPFKIGLFYRHGKGWPRLAELQTHDGRYPQLRTQDVDGDGDDEIIVRDRIFGLADSTPTAYEYNADLFMAAGNLPPPSRACEILQRARDAAGLKLLEDAFDLYGQVCETPESREDLEEAAKGRIRCLISMNRVQEASREALSLIDDNPFLLESLGVWAEKKFTDQGEWTLAAPLAKRLLDSRRITRSEQKRLLDTINQAEQLAMLAPVVTMETLRNDPEAVLLASNPVMAAFGEDNTLDVFVHGEKQDEALFVPLVRKGGSFRLDTDVVAARLDWHNTLEMGVITGAPWRYGSGKPGNWRHPVPDPLPEMDQAGFEFEAYGNAAFPGLLFWWQVSGRREMGDADLEPGDALSVTLTYAESKKRLRCEWSTPRNGVVSYGKSDVAFGKSDATFLYIRGHGLISSRWSHSHIVIPRLSLLGPEEALNFAPFEPACSADHFFLANGLYVRGRFEAALAEYDKAVDMADAELAAAKEKGETPKGYRVHVDARFWRALLRARMGGDQDAAVAEMLAVANMDEDRVIALLEHCALPLRHREKETAFLLSFYRAAHRDSPQQDRPFEQWLPKVLSKEMQVTLLPLIGMKLWRRHQLLRAEKAFVPGKPADSALKPGDVILRYDGQPADHPYQFQLHQDRARRRGEAVIVRLLRDGTEMELRLDPTEVWLATRFVESVEKDP